MSKGLGQKIAIKFTEEITSFDESILSDVQTQQFALSALGTYSTNTPDRLKDGSTSTYWETRTTSNNLLIELIKPSTVINLKWYTGSSYRPTTFTISVSSDGINFTTAMTSTSAALTGWQTFAFETPVECKFIKIVFTAIATRLYLYELAVTTKEYSHPTNEFSLSGKERAYVGGPLVDKQYPIMRIMRHPTESNALLIITNDIIRFNNIEGLLKINYDSLIGNLSGVAGKVESFEVSFTPTELEAKPNPHVAETIIVTSIATVDFIRIYYTNAYASEAIEVSAIATVDFIDVGTINP